MTARIDTGALLLGRVALAACVAPSGIAHAMNISGFAVLLAKQGLPFAHGLATARVLIEVFGPLACVLGLAPRLSAALFGLRCARLWRCIGSGSWAEQPASLSRCSF